MLNDITLGQYFPGRFSDSPHGPAHEADFDDFLHRRRVLRGQTCPDTRLRWLFLYIVVRVSRHQVYHICSKGIKPLRFIIIFTFVLNLFFVQGETPLVYAGLFHTDAGSAELTRFTSRCAWFSWCMGTSVLTLTTSPVQLTDGLERIMHPLEKIHFPAHELAMMMTIALRFIPTLLEETDKIQKAQMARGADFESGNLIARAKAMIPLLVPLFVSSFRRANELAMAMEARCYHGGDHRTRLRELKYTKLRPRSARSAMAAFLAVIIVAEGRLLG